MSLGSKKEKTTSVVEEAADAFVPVSVSETSRDEGGTFSSKHFISEDKVYYGID